MPVSFLGKMSNEGTFSLVRRQLRLVRVATWTSWVLSAASMVERIYREDPDTVVDRWKLRWARGMKDIVGLDPRLVHGEPAPTRERGRLVVANHRTPLDIVTLLSLFGGHFLANHKVARAPIVGRGAHRIGTVFVDRGDRRSGAAAIRQMRRLLEEKRTVIVFPEGTTFGGDEVRPFKGGAFSAAAGLDVEVIPVGLAYLPGHEFDAGSLGAHVRSFLARARTPAWVSVGESLAMPQVRRGFDEEVRGHVQALVERSRLAAVEALSDRERPALAAPAEGDRSAPR